MTALNIPVEIASPSIEPGVRLPVVELITQDIINALKGVTVVNGYQTELTVQRGYGSGNLIGDMVAVVAETDCEMNVPQASSDSVAWIQHYCIDVLAFESEASTYPIRRRLQIAYADIHKAVMGNLSLAQRNGLANDTTPMVPSWAGNAGMKGARDGLILEFSVKYMTALYDPYQLRTGFPDNF